MARRSLRPRSRSHVGGAAVDPPLIPVISNGGRTSWLLQNGPLRASAVAGSFPNQLFQRAFHACSVGRGFPARAAAALEGAAGLRLHDVEEVADSLVVVDRC